MQLPLWNGLPVGMAHASAELQKALASDLDSYAASVRGRGVPTSFKVINDPIWFTVRIEPWELVVLDSPLIQRLRNIRQLGLAGMVYPAAGYSRFEHTIGTLYQTQRVLEAVNHNARSYGTTPSARTEHPVSRSDEVLLRLAAMLHDVGHCFLSHVSERALSRIQLTDGINLKFACSEARNFFKTVKKPAVGELLSALIILLPEFVNILKLAQIPFWQDNEKDLAQALAHLIVRGRLSDRPFMNEIISGALDADKLDYMSRDCYMAGLAMPIDTERLLEKLCVVGVPASHLGEYSESMSLHRDQTIQVLAVQQGGAKVFEDFVLSRVLLYDKLYNHHKVRALEGAIVNALEVLRSSHPDFKSLCGYVRFSDTEFMEGRWAGKENLTPEASLAIRIVQEVRRRNFVRAFAFGPSFLQENTEPSDEAEVKVRQSWRNLASITSRDITETSLAFREKITVRAQKYLTTLGQPVLASQLHPSLLVVDLPDIQGIASRTKFFVGDENSGVRFFNELFRVEKWAEAYENQKIAGYIFCPAEYAVAVHLAARDIINEEFGLAFEPWSWSLTKVSVIALEQAASMLRYRDIATQEFPIPEGLRARKVYLESKGGKVVSLKRYIGDLDQLAEHFTSFQFATSERISRHRIEDWLSQFETKDIPILITVLRNINYWNRARLVDTFGCGIDLWVEDFQMTQWLPLGGPTTSAHHLNYLWPDLRSKKGSPLVLGSAEELSEDIPIVVYDDNIGSGGQSITVLQQWLGVDREDWTIKESHVPRLSEKKLQILRSSKITFLFATGRRDGLAKLISATRNLLSNTNVVGHIVSPHDISCFGPASGVFANSSQAGRAKEVLTDAGRKALSDKIEEWGPEKTEQRLLGYGNNAGLNVFYYNVPTTTLTALWKSSTHTTGRWMGLFPRRPRS